MEISWYGQSCFRIKAKEGIVVIDPFVKIGLVEPKLKADICLVTHNHPDHNNISLVSGISSAKPFFVSGPGEYEIGNIIVNGINSSHTSGEEGEPNTIYTFTAEGISVCHLGDLGQKSLSDAQLEALNGVDILMVPVGGKYTIDGKEAVDIISQIEPKIVIPMHYKIAGLTIDIDDITKFTKAEGVSGESKEPVLKISAATMPEEERETVILKPIH